MNNKKLAKLNIINCSCGKEITSFSILENGLCCKYCNKSYRNKKLFQIVTNAGLFHKRLIGDFERWKNNPKIKLTNQEIEEAIRYNTEKLEKVKMLGLNVAILMSLKTS